MLRLLIIIAIYTLLGESITVLSASVSQHELPAARDRPTPPRVFARRFNWDNTVEWDQTTDSDEQTTNDTLPSIQSESQSAPEGESDNTVIGRLLSEIQLLSKSSKFQTDDYTTRLQSIDREIEELFIGVVNTVN